MTPEELEQIAEDERAAQATVPASRERLCCGGCISCQSQSVKDAIDKEIAKRGWQKKCQSKGVGCMGLCAEGPLVSTGAGTLYQHVTAADAGEKSSMLSTGPAREPPRSAVPTCRSSSGRRRSSWRIPALSIPSASRITSVRRGYGALMRVLTEMTPSEVVQEVVKSGLRGRGGAGYPTGLKWSTVAKAGGGQKYVICNADEGDPGAFMDRSVLESDPHRVLEGMLIAAYAVGASEGYIYVRAEYPLAIKRLRTAIRQAERIGLLGTSICGTRFSFRIDIAAGRRRLRLRRGNGADRVGGREARHASSASAISGAGGPVRRAHADQQRGNLCQHPAHHPQRRRLVCADRHREEQGDQGLRAGGPSA